MGNYSKKPEDVLADARAKNYSSVRFQQGKPILDRELNLLGDLAGTALSYMGNGVRMGSDAFQIVVPDPRIIPLLDFQITPGTCLVNGLEVTLAAATTYQNQPYKKNVKPVPMPDANKMYWLYLHVFPREVGEADDPDLGNAGDVGFETALREKAEWEVVVLDDAEMKSVQDKPDYFRLASLMYVNIGPTFMWGTQQYRMAVLAAMSLVEVMNYRFTLSAGASNVYPLHSELGQHHFCLMSVITDKTGDVVTWQEMVAGATRHVTIKNISSITVSGSIRMVELVTTGR